MRTYRRGAPQSSRGFPRFPHARSGGMCHAASMPPRFPGIQAVLFDVDGTLLDTTEFIFGAYAHACEAFGILSPGREWLALQIGRKLEDVYDDFAPEFRDDMIEVHRTFQATHLELATPFAGAVETLEAIKTAGLRIAAVTSRSNRTSRDSLVVAGIAGYFDTVISAEDAVALKPDPAPLAEAVERLRVEKQTAIMVGDSLHDVHAAHNYGIPVVAVTYGFPGRTVLEANPTIHIDDIRLLPPLIL